MKIRKNGKNDFDEQLYKISLTKFEIDCIKIANEHNKSPGLIKNIEFDSEKHYIFEQIKNIGLKILKGYIIKSGLKMGIRSLRKKHTAGEFSDERINSIVFFINSYMQSNPPKKCIENLAKF